MYTYTSYISTELTFFLLQHISPYNSSGLLCGCNILRASDYLGGWDHLGTHFMLLNNLLIYTNTCRYFNNYACHIETLQGSVINDFLDLPLTGKRWAAENSRQLQMHLCPNDSFSKVGRFIEVARQQIVPTR